MKRLTFLLTFLLCAVFGMQGQNLTLPYYQDFSSLSNGDMLSENGSTTAVATMPTGIASATAAYEAGGVIRLGEATSAGSITTQPIEVGDASKVKVSFRATPWRGTTQLPSHLQVTYGTQIDTVQIPSSGASWPISATDMDNFYSVEFDALTTPTAISITSIVDAGTLESRVFFDNLVIKAKVSGYILQEGFEGTQFPPVDWKRINVSGTSVWERYVGGVPIGAASAAIQWASAGHENYLITPKLRVATGDNLKFKVKAVSYYPGTTLNIKISTTGNAASDFNATALTLSNQAVTTSWVQHTVDLSAYVGQDIYIAFHVVDNDGLRLMLDEVEGPQVSTPYCPDILGFRLGAIDENTATVLWNTSTNYNAVVVEYSSTSDFSADVISDTVVGNNTITISGLESDSVYYVRAYADCLAGDVTSSTATLTIQTACAAISSITEDFESYTLNSNGYGPFSSCWRKISSDSNYPAVVTPDANNGVSSKSIKFLGSLPQYVVTGRLDAPLSTLQLRFKLNREGGSSGPFQVGYMSNPNDASTFVAVATFNDLGPYKTFLDKTVNFDTVVDNGANRYIAFRRGNVEGMSTGSSVWYYWIDDVRVAPAPTCLPPVNIHTTYVGSDSVRFTFNRTNPTNSWEYVIGAVSDSPGALTPVAISTTAPDTVIITSLTPNTQYSLWVRSVCSATDTSEWTAYPCVFKTRCEPLSVIADDFNSYILPTSVSSSILPECWSKISSYGTRPSIVASDATYHGTTSNSVRFNGSKPQYVVTNWLDAPLSTKILKFKLNRQSMDCGVFQVGYMSDPTDVSTFVPIATYDDNVYTSFVEHILPFTGVTDDGNNRYVAFRYGDVGNIIQNIYRYYHIDDVEIIDMPQCTPIMEAKSQLFGSDSVRITFGSIGSASAWQYTFDNPTVVDEANLTKVDFTTDTLRFTGLQADSTYMVWIRQNCGSGSYSDWTAVTYTTQYCNGSPEGVDGHGIINVKFGLNELSNPTAAETGNYGDYTAIVGEAAKGSDMPMSITYSTSTTYRTKIYIDWNKDFDFYDEGELMYEFESPSTTPTTTNFSFNIPATVQNGEYRMRIVGTDTGDSNPCYSGTYGCIEDYTVRVVDAITCPYPTGIVVNSITETGADISWTAGGSETSWKVIVSGTELDQAALSASTSAVTVNNTPSYQATGLTANTDYYVYIQADCGASNGVSYWKGATFRTKSVAVSLPYNQDFTGSANELALVANGMNKWSVGSATGNAANSMYVSKDNGTTAEYSNRTSFTTASVRINFGNSPKFSLAFDWIGVGNMYSSSWYNTLYAGMKVYMVPDSLDIPTSGAIRTPSSWITGPGVLEIGSLFINQNSWTTFSTELPASYANTTQKLVFVWANDYSDSKTPTTAIDNISVTPVYCDAPTSFAVDSISDNYAKVIWEKGGSETSWEVEYKTRTSATWTALASVTDTFAVLSNLTPATDYYVRVRANCGTPGQYSQWAQFSFKTQCVAYTVGTTMLQYNFDEYIGTIPDCWTRVSSATYEGGTYPLVGTTTSAPTDGILIFRGIGTQVISTRQLVEQANTLEVRFILARESAANSGTFEVGVMSDPFNSSTFVPLHTVSDMFTVADNTFENFTLSLSAAPVGNHYIAFRHVTSQGGYYVMDDLGIYTTPTCPAPSGVTVAYNDPTATSAEVSWVPSGSEQAWVVQYMHVDSTTWNTLSVSTTNAVITGLTPANAYYVRVAAVCIAGSDTSFWTPTRVFRTPCAAMSLPFEETFDALSSTNFPASCWNRYSTMFVDNIATSALTAGGGWSYSNNGHGLATAKATLNVWGTSLNSWLVTPPIQLGSNSVLEFDMALTQWGTGNAPSAVGPDDKFMVIVSSDAGLTWAAANATVWNNDGTGNYVLSDVPATGTRVSIDLSQYSGIVRIAFYGQSTATNADIDIHLDSISVYEVIVIPPTVETQAATDITNTSATLNKLVTAGTHAITSEGFYYKAVSNTRWAQSLSGSVTGLAPGTVYEFYAYADVNGTIYRGDTLQFTTTGTASIPPTVTTEAATNVTPTTATLHKTVTADPSEPVLTEGWKYRKATASSWTISTDGQLTGLDHNSTYEFYAFATTAVNAAGYNGATLTFTTPAHTQPTVVTGQATNVQCNSATLVKTVTPGTETITEEGWYYRRASASQWIKTTSANISNLAQNTTYEYYAYATTASYPETKGATLTFTTPPCTGLDIAAYAVQIYPNPATNVVTIAVDGITQPADVTIVDITGKTVGRYTMANGTNSLNVDVTSFAEGTYVVRIVSDNINTTKRLVVKK